MTQEEIRKQVETLNQLFNVEPCRVRFEENPYYGREAVYYPFNQGITFHARRLEGITPSLVVHEFAHHLNAQRHHAQKHLKSARRTVKDYAKRLKAWNFGYAEQQQAALALRCKPRSLKRKRQVHHGDDFVLCLRQVIRKTGMDYSPSREYITVAKKLGLR